MPPWLLALVLVWEAQVPHCICWNCKDRCEPGQNISDISKTLSSYIGNPSTDAVLLARNIFAALWLGHTVRVLHLGMVTIVTNIIMIIMKNSMLK